MTRAASCGSEAIFADSLPGNVLAQAGKEDRFTTKEGIAVAGLTTAQQDLLLKLIETTTVLPWSSPIVEQQRRRIKEGSVHFA